MCELPFGDLSAGQTTLLEDAGAGKKVGSVLRLRLGGRHLLLGENGCGKTTLLRAIQNREIPGWPAHVSTCLVEQAALQAVASERCSPDDAAPAEEVPDATSPIGGAEVCSPGSPAEMVETLMSMRLRTSSDALRRTRSESSVSRDTGGANTPCAAAPTPARNCGEDPERTQPPKTASSMTALEFLLDADTSRNHRLERVAAVEAEMSKEGLPAERVGELAEELGELWDAMEDEGQRRLRATQILANVGFAAPGITEEKSSQVTSVETLMSELSGGWLCRVALAAGLFGDPQVLMLDEPTNHLDVAGIQWLESFLREHYTPESGKTLLCVSHDRAFLNTVVSDLVVMRDRKLRFFHGSLDAFEEAAVQLEQRLAKAQAVAEVQKKEREAAIADKEARDEQWESRARRNKQTNKTKYAQFHAGLYGGALSRKVTVLSKKNQRCGMEKNLDGKAFKASRDGERLFSEDGAGLEAVLAAAPVAVLKDPNMRLQFPADVLQPSSSGDPPCLATVKDVCFSYCASSNPRGADGSRPGEELNDNFVIADVSFEIAYGEKIALVGDNGAGKTTFLKLLQNCRLELVVEEPWKEGEEPVQRVLGGDTGDGAPHAAPGHRCLAQVANELGMDLLHGLENDVECAFSTGRLVPTCGEMVRKRGFRWSFVTQQESEALGAETFARTTAAQYLANVCEAKKLLEGSRHPDEAILSALEAFGIRDATARRQALNTLSAGQRVRVALARVSLEKPHLLILDEPSNHLDLYSVEALTRALVDFPGAVVFATHHRELVMSVADKVVRLGVNGSGCEVVDK